jgi:hypothetical protein
MRTSAAAFVSQRHFGSPSWRHDRARRVAPLVRRNKVKVVARSGWLSNIQAPDRDDFELGQASVNIE